MKIVRMKYASYECGSLIATRDGANMRIDTSHTVGGLMRATTETTSAVIVEAADLYSMWQILECIACEYPRKVCEALGVKVPAPEVNP